ncbi:MAG: hypothetical protein ACREN7_00505 [Candidatus Dormibacteria bacterium]
MTLAALALLTTFWLLIARRVRGAVAGYSAQSFALGGLAIAVSVSSGLVNLLLLGLVIVAIKGLLIPLVLRRQIRSTVYDRRETRYHVGFPTAMLVGAALSVLGFAVAAQLHLTGEALRGPVLGLAVAIVLLGLFTSVARRDAVMELAGLLAAENGLLMVGLVVAPGLGLLVELALFLDVLVGVLVMGFLIARMQETVASTDTSELRRLRG